ncbi:phage portal protein [Sphingopyxis sp. GW247-27LB]|uniref:phage portal protein n=1 Tax=Sphingopyxis sp. GW247-27LB TaxID=2012632 RepID=UPI000BA52B85|nr:phage portal protein [Sphingopyxis sp. GW247-27LB]PAL23529.1 phage portal protein [Sphingopyxis sp. GW247-27LB]
MSLSEFDDLIGVPSPPPSASPPPQVLVPSSGGGDMAMGGFEGADQFDRTLSLWSPPLQSADADILPDKDVGDGRIRALLNDDAYIQGVARLRKDNVVGHQFLLNARPSIGYLNREARRKGMPATFDENWEEEFQEEVEELFDLWAESPDNWVDSKRQNSFTEMVRLMIGVHLAGGEVLATAEWDREGFGEFKTVINLIDLDRLSTDPDHRNDKMVRAGVRFDSRGRPVAYQIREGHPSDVQWTYLYDLPRWREHPIRTKWGRLQVLHIKEDMRVDQTRGFSDLMSTIKPSKMGHRLRDVALQQQVLQSLYAGAITSELPAEQVFAQLGGGEISPDAVAKAINSYATGYLGQIEQYVGNSRALQMDGARVPHLFPGTKFELMSPGKGGVVGTDFERSLNMYQSVAAGVSYEQFTHDYSKTNYSSARAGEGNTWKFMQALKRLIAERAANSVYRLFLEEGVNQNKLTTFPKAKAGLLYTDAGRDGRLNMAFSALARADWIGAARGQIDELKETEAAILRIDNGLSTREEELARLGKDWRRVYRQRAREKREEERLGLTFGDHAMNGAARTEPQSQSEEESAP